VRASNLYRMLNFSAAGNECGVAGGSTKELVIRMWPDLVLNASREGMTWNYRLLGLLSILMNKYEGIAPIGIDKGSVKVKVTFCLSTT